VSRYRLGDPLCIADVADHERTPFHEITMTRRQIVEADRDIPRFRQSLAAMGADITGSAGYEYCRPLGHLFPDAMKSAWDSDRHSARTE